MRKKIRKQSVGLPRTTLKYPQSGAGFTLVEVLIVIGIFGMLSAMMLVRYNRGNEDSILTRQAALIIADIRLAQEQTAGGTTVRYCSSDTGKLCTKDADCVSTGCSVEVTPPGGLAVLFSCTSTYLQDQLYFSQLGKSKYFTYADAVQCGTGDYCFAPVWGGGSQWHSGETDGLISSYLSGGNLKGDPLVATHTLVPTVEIKDIQLVDEANVSYRCASGGSPWNGRQESTHLDSVPSDYPLQALVRFPAPDGRKTVISDNISSVAYSSNPWVRIDIMLGVTTRAIDCRVISITKDGVISQRVDADCSLATT